jgi:hypothetical protein
MFVMESRDELYHVPELAVEGIDTKVRLENTVTAQCCEVYYACQVMLSKEQPRQSQWCSAASSASPSLPGPGPGLAVELPPLKLQWYLNL